MKKHCRKTKSEIALTIARARTAKDQSLFDVAINSDTSSSSVKRAEAGTLDSLDTLVAILDSLDLTLSVTTQSTNHDKLAVLTKEYIDSASKLI